jgi:YcaO-like protein with predicted kinase domain
MIPGREPTMHREGTHRARTGDETWAQLAGLLPVVGITRLAALTWLDGAGVPTYQAIRPQTRNLSVSQGKGITDQLARISAVMESIESWHAERVVPGERALLGDVQSTLPYDWRRLPLASPCALDPGSTIAWLPATGLDGSSTLIPRALVDLDSTVDRRWEVPGFLASSNGLAAGNTRTEAVLHGLYEVIERDCLAGWDATPREGWHRVDPATVPGTTGELLRRLSDHGVHAELYDITGEIPIPCFTAFLWSSSFPLRMLGSGAHLDATVALSRAVTEAAQARLGSISGARDDMGRGLFQLARARALDEYSDPGGTLHPFTPRYAGEHLDEDLATVAQLLAERGFSAWVVEHTRPEVGVPVVHVVVPGMRGPQH